MNQLPIILASTSVFRAQLLDKLNLEFTQSAPKCNESQLDNESAFDMAARLSQVKAISLSDKFNKHLIIGSDQVCFVDGQVLGKPKTAENAIKQLQLASGKKATFYTATSLHNSFTGKNQQKTDVFHVYFRSLSIEEIQRYIEQEQPLQCAGSFKSEGLGITLFEKLEGDDPNSLIGLPLITLCSMLRNENYLLP